VIPLAVTDPDGFSNRELRELLAPMLGVDRASMTQGRMTYHLRRLRLHGLIERTPHTLRYRVTDFGLRSALVLTRVHNRFLTTVMAEVSQPSQAAPRSAEPSTPWPPRSTTPPPARASQREQTRLTHP